MLEIKERRESSICNALNIYMRWYGSIQNRINENKQFVPEIKVGDGVTEYYYSDSHAYEVVDVKDQKHITIRQYDAKNKAAYDNDWILTSNENNPREDLVKRGKYWYSECVVRFKDFEEIYNKYINNIPYNEDEIFSAIWLANRGIGLEELKEKGTIKRYSKRNISIGVAQEYYDWTF